MNPNNPQPQDDRDRDGVPIPVVGPAPQYQAAAPAPQPAQQQGQPQMPPPVPGWFAAEPLPDDEPPHRDRTPIPFGRILKVLVFVLLVGGIVGGVGYGLVSIFGQSEKEQDRLATAQEAFNEEVKKVIYVGDGSDIERTEKPKISYACPTGYEKTPSGKTCLSRDRILAVSSDYTCKSGYKKTGSVASPECSKIKGGTKETKNAAKTTKCENGYEASGNDCKKNDTIDSEKTYSCPSGYTKSGNGPQTTCSKSVPVQGALVSSCPSGYTLRGVGATATCTRPGVGGPVKEFPADACNAGYTRNDVICSKRGEPYTTTRSYCSVAGFAPLDSNYCYKDVSKVSGGIAYYRCSYGSVYGSVCIVPVARIKGVCPIKTIYPNCSRSVGSATPVYNYVCPKSLYRIYSLGSTCRQTTPKTTVTERNYACPSDSIKSLDGGNTICSYTTTKYSTPTRCSVGRPVGTSCVQYSDVDYACKSGLHRVGSGIGTVCLTTTGGIKDVITKVTCPKGTTQQGDKCSGTITVNANVSYKCDSGYDLEGTKCTRIVGGTKVTSEVKKIEVCRAGYKKEGSGSKAKCVQQSNVKIGLQKVYTCKDGWKQKIDGKKVTCVLVRAS